MELENHTTCAAEQRNQGWKRWGCMASPLRSDKKHCLQGKMIFSSIRWCLALWSILRIDNAVLDRYCHSSIGLHHLKQKKLVCINGLVT